MKLPHRRQFLHLAAGAAALPAVSRFANAQAYPNKVIKFIVPFLPGTPNDVIARRLNRNNFYDPIKDFTAVASVASTEWVLVIAPAVPANSLEAFVAYAR